MMMIFPTAEDVVGSIGECRFLMDNTKSFPLVKAFCDPPVIFASILYAFSTFKLPAQKKIMHLYKRAPRRRRRRSTSIIIVLLKWKNSMRKKEMVG